METPDSLLCSTVCHFCICCKVPCLVQQIPCTKELLLSYFHEDPFTLKREKLDFTPRCPQVIGFLYCHWLACNSSTTV